MLSLVSLAHRMLWAEASNPALQTGVPHGNRDTMTPQFKMALAGHAQRHCASTAIQSMSSAGATDPRQLYPLPADKIPIKQLRPWPGLQRAEGTVCSRAGLAGTSPSFATEPNCISYWLKQHTWQKDPCWGPTQEGR